MKPLLITLILFSSTPGLCQMKIDRKHFVDLLNDGKYYEAYEKAYTLRQKPYGKNAVIDYILAKSLCLRGMYSQSQTWFNHINTNYSLKPLQKQFINNEKRLCTQVNATNSINTFTNFSYINYAPLPESGTNGKEGFTLRCLERNEENNSMGIDLVELESRLFNNDQRNKAFHKIKSIVGGAYLVDTSGRFVVVSLVQSNYNNSDNRAVAKKLEFAYRFYLQKYHLQPSDKLFTVYLLPDRTSLKAIANKVHRISLPANAIGYSSIADLSLLGIGNPNSVGTLYHELFHLAIRTDVGDIPAWLDEGIASLYSVYKINGDELTGLKNPWRIQHFKLLALLAKDKIVVPSLEQLISMSWYDFEGGEKGNTCISSINYALANLLLIYLQENRLVYPMVDAFKNRLDLQKEPSGNDFDNVSVVESVFKKPIAAISVEFNDWLKRSYNISLSKLIQKSPAVRTGYWDRYGDGMPENISRLSWEIDSLIRKIEKDSVDTGPVNLRVIRYKQQDLKQECFRITDTYKQVLNEKIHAINRRILENDQMIDYPSDLESLETQLDAKESEMLRIKTTLLNILSKGR